MTIEEAIKHCEEVADSKCDACGAEHRQLAEWLKELKERRRTLQSICDSLRHEFYGYDSETDYYAGYDDGIKRAMAIVESER